MAEKFSNEHFVEHFVAHWYATYGPQVRHRNLGEGHIFDGPLENANPWPSVWCALLIVFKKSDSVPQQFYCFVSAP